MIRTSKNWWKTILWIAIFIYFLLTLIISLSYHWGYMSSVTDIGTFDQAIWGTLHGHFFLNTIAFNKAINYLGFHFRPILLIFLPFYILLPKVEWMILAQSFALSLTALPICATFSSPAPTVPEHSSEMNLWHELSEATLPTANYPNSCHRHHPATTPIPC